MNKAQELNQVPRLVTHRFQERMNNGLRIGDVLLLCDGSVAQILHRYNTFTGVPDQMKDEIEISIFSDEPDTKPSQEAYEERNLLPCYHFSIIRYPDTHSGLKPMQWGNFFTHAEIIDMDEGDGICFERYSNQPVILDNQ